MARDASPFHIRPIPPFLNGLKISPVPIIPRNLFGLIPGANDKDYDDDGNYSNGKQVLFHNFSEML